MQLYYCLTYREIKHTHGVRVRAMAIKGVLTLGGPTHSRECLTPKDRLGWPMWSLQAVHVLPLGRRVDGLDSCTARSLTEPRLQTQILSCALFNKARILGLITGQAFILDLNVDCCLRIKLQILPATSTASVKYLFLGAKRLHLIAQ